MLTCGILIFAIRISSGAFVVPHPVPVWVDTSSLLLLNPTHLSLAGWLTEGLSMKKVNLNGKSLYVALDVLYILLLPSACKVTQAVLDAWSILQEWMLEASTVWTFMTKHDAGCRQKEGLRCCLAQDKDCCLRTFSPKITFSFRLRNEELAAAVAEASTKRESAAKLF